MLESGSDRSPPPPKNGCSSRGDLEKELPPSSSKIRKHDFEACSSPGQQPQRRPPPPKILGVPPLGFARVWAWTCSNVGLGLARVWALLLQKYSGSPLWGLLECVLCAALLLQKYSSCKKLNFMRLRRQCFPPPPGHGQLIWGYRFPNFGSSSSIFFIYTLQT